MTLSPRSLELQVIGSLGDLVILSEPGEKPIRVALRGDAEGIVLRIYAWNITHGGATRSPDEFRIQLTGSRPDAVLGEQTLILGWSDEFEVFGAWDPTVHLGRFSSSPSLQIHRDTLTRARVDGIAPELRGSGDITVALTSELLRGYALSAASLHTEDPAMVAEDLQTIPTGGPARIPEMRTKVTQTVQTYFRAADFSRRVGAAYDYHCAICGLQLALVEAAHIVPVAWPGSTDETANGLCLCRNHHKAFDDGLIGVDPDYTVRVSRAHVEELDRLGLTDGLAELTSHDGLPLRYLPAKPNDRPRPDYLDEGQRLRQ